MDLMPSLTKRERAVASKYRKYLRAKERAEYFYTRADRLCFQIASRLKQQHGATVRTSTDGRGIMLLDNFLVAALKPKDDPNDMPKAWGHGAVRQFDLKEIKLSQEDK